MAQKNKVKELVGRGLNSYHTKALQQMDRIEKKNKEQNHKISILSNELDNDYLTKTEEGSVISLEHSKEGMVYLDELQGNTLVNYCTDGAKELTLNGDIDVEGTNVTLTEGVDNGKVDVMCEGNTLVNLMPNTTTVTGASETPTTTIFWFVGDNINNDLFKPNTKYSVIFYNKHPKVVRAYFHLASPTTVDVIDNVAVFTTPSIIETAKTVIHFYTNENITIDEVRQSNIKAIILEGDYTNKPIPSYFEGMKSVGECEDNKIEILSQNKNLLDETTIIPYNMSSIKKEDGWYVCDDGNYGGVRIGKAFLKKGVQYYLNFEYENISNGGHWCVPPIGTTNYAYLGGNVGMSLPQGIGNKSIKLGIPNEDCYVDCMVLRSSTSGTIKYRNISITTEPTTSYVKYSLNKKEILMNEPLRSLPSGVKDKFVKINNKFYIERNCGTFTFNGSESGWTKRKHLSEDYETYSITDENLDKIIKYAYISTVKNNDLVCDKLISLPIIGGVSEMYRLNYACTALLSNGSTNSAGRGYYINIAKSTLGSKTINQWLSENNITIVFKNLNPTYEPLEVEPTLLTYNDVTHISNNSTIPCNMKIQNSGYNAIIKPSTLYTVALDTNKTGTIGMNLGGAKVTTTNNVATITTPATLTDDSLRIYGKGIKGSKVRLLEGDKTNWIPSHFEGMKSSFEDKFDTTDNTYKMEILSNNKNLFNLDNFELGSYGEIKNGIITVKNPRQGQYDSAGVFKLKTPSCFKGKWITLSTNKTQGEGNIEIRQYDISNNQIWVHVSSTFSFKVLDSCEYISLNFNSRTTGTTTSWENIQIETSNSKTPYIEPKSNKIQFSSIEPLRSVGDIKDKFVFKDGKLMIERNCIQSMLDGTSSFDYVDNSTYSNSVVRFNYNNPSILKGEGVNDDRILCNTLPSMKHSLSESNKKSIRIHGTSDNTVLLYINKNELNSLDVNGLYEWLVQNPTEIIFASKEPTYEEIPFELQKLILEGYENGTLFFDTNIPPTSTVTYAGETPIVKSVRLNKTEVLNNTNDINDNIVPYLMDMDYRVVCLQLQSENINDGVSMARLFGGTYEMLQRDIQSKRYSIDEYKHRLDAYLDANKITEEEYNKLGDMLNE